MNLLIAGIGRQGINSLAKVLATTFDAAGRTCVYTVHKGGAQSLGSVYAEMRVMPGALPVLGASIPPGKLDVLVAMDPWEALRHLPLAHSGTRCFIEEHLMPFFSERAPTGDREVFLDDPIDRLKQLGIPITWRSYREEAIACAGAASMANYYAGLDCLHAIGVDDEDMYRRIFSSTIVAAPGKMV